MIQASLADIHSRLRRVLGELERQPEVSTSYSTGSLPYPDEMQQIREFIEVGEEGLAYEYLVGTIEFHPFVLSGAAAVALLELGLTFGFKTESPEDRKFDRRDREPGGG